MNDDALLAALDLGPEDLNGGDLPVRSPIDGATIARVRQHDAAEAPALVAQAQAAFELCLAELQAGDLDVEAMAGLYRRALAYSARCEELLQQVEQEVMQWDAERPDDAPEPFPS